MPELPIAKIQKGAHWLPVSLSALSVLSVMHYPDDEQAKQCFKSTIFASIIHENELFWALKSEEAILWTLLNYLCPSFQEVCINAKQKSRRAIQVGNVLYTIWAMDEICPENEPSLRKAIYCAKETLGIAKNKHKNINIGATEQSLWNYWKSFSSVSHLWAALFHIDILMKVSENELTLEEYVKFLAYAELFRKYGENRISSRNGEPLLNKDVTYKVPTEIELPHVELRFAETFGKEQCEKILPFLLEDYSKRNVY